MLNMVLTEEQKELAYELAIQGISLAKIANALGFTNDMAFFRHCRSNPDFKSELDSARIQSCAHMEDKILEIPATCADAKIGMVALNCYSSVMRFRDPNRYGNKVAIDVTQTLDISGSLSRIDEQIALTYRDITPQLEKPNKIKDIL